jgi:hypothetical protein
MDAPVVSPRRDFLMGTQLVYFLPRNITVAGGVTRVSVDSVPTHLTLGCCPVLLTYKLLYPRVTKDRHDYSVLACTNLGFREGPRQATYVGSRGMK